MADVDEVMVAVAPATWTLHVVGSVGAAQLSQKVRLQTLFHWKIQNI